MKYGDFSMKKAYTFYVSVVADPVDNNGHCQFRNDRKYKNLC